MRLLVHDRNYTSWTFESDCPWNPAEKKLFHLDQIGDIIRSPTRDNPNIPGVLVLEKNCTFGRTANKKRLLYKCIPYDRHLPIFLVPYEIPFGFHKNFRNKFVTFRFDSWNEKHPRGILSQTIGDVDDLPSFYEYQLYCKGLHASIAPAVKHCKGSRDEWMERIRSDEKYGVIEIRNDSHIFSIDPLGCTDRDDAIRIVPVDENFLVSVYIANLWPWIEAFGLWDKIGSRIATLYLPDKKRNMFPTTISEECCSLDAKKSTFAVVMDMLISANGITFSQMKQVEITVHKNYVYEEPRLLQSIPYQNLLKVTKGLDATIQDSHEVVAFWMLQMNQQVAKELRALQTGIFRITSMCTPTLKFWEQKVAGSYVRFQENLEHHVLGVSEYVHFTSPIRRMVDFLNHLAWLSTLLPLSDAARTFIDKMDLEYINKTMKTIRKMQSDCDILHEVSLRPDVLDAVLSGVVIGLGEKYTVFIPELKWITTLYSSRSLALNEQIQCRARIFEREDTFFRKVRVVLNEFGS